MLVLQRQRHLKWRAFDTLETILMILPEGTVVNPFTCRTDWKTR